MAALNLSENHCFDLKPLALEVKLVLKETARILDSHQVHSCWTQIPLQALVKVLYFLKAIRVLTAMSVKRVKKQAKE